MTTDDRNIVSSENRINELINELNNCREDERNSQNQIIQVIVTAGTILGILLGASYFSISDTGADETVEKVVSVVANDYARVTFWLSICVFCVAFTYIMTLGTGNLLRYYYMQELEDRLHELIPTGDDDAIADGLFVHWVSFSGPIITRNPHHIESAYTALHFLNYTIAACFAVIFSMGLIHFQYSRIEPEWYDIVGFVGAFILMVAVLVLFIITSIFAKKMVKFASKTAKDNLTARMSGHPDESYDKAHEFHRILLYFLYPKLKDIQKPFLIVLGFVGGLIFSHYNFGVQSAEIYCWRIVLILICFDFFAYQARFLINDLRGIREANNPLRDEAGEIVPEYVQISIAVILVRIVLAVGMTVICWNTAIGLPLFVALVVLVCITIVYEVARSKQCQKGIYFWVGAGYPLRFFLGAFAAIPLGHRFEIMCSIQFVLLLIAFWAYGMYSAIMAWTNEVVDKMKAGKDLSESYKEHFLSLRDTLNIRYVRASDHRIGDDFFPLREAGHFNDVWNITYICSLSCLAIVSYILLLPTYVQAMELLAVVCFCLMVPSCYEYIKALFIGGCILTAIPIAVMMVDRTFLVEYILLCLPQYLFVMTYFILRYSPQMKPLDMKRIVAVLCKIIFGEKVFDLFFRHDEGGAGKNGE